MAKNKEKIPTVTELNKALLSEYSRTVDYKQKSLGLFFTSGEAYSARLEAEKKYFGEFTTKGSDD